MSPKHSADGTVSLLFPRAFPWTGQVLTIILPTMPSRKTPENPVKYDPSSARRCSEKNGFLPVWFLLLQKSKQALPLINLSSHTQGLSKSTTVETVVVDGRIGELVDNPPLGEEGGGAPERRKKEISIRTIISPERHN